MEWVYDRTQSDVDRAAELNQKYIAGIITTEENAEWEAGLKGALNVSDLNRIEQNLTIVAQLLNVAITEKSWSLGDIPRENDYFRILDNLQAVRAAWYDVAESPPTPTQPLNTYQKWNNIEKILHDLYEMLIKSYYYSGTEIIAGEGIGII